MATIKDIIKAKKKQLSKMAAEPMAALAEKVVTVWSNPDQLDAVLNESIKDLPYCDMLYAVETHGILISSNVATDYTDTQWRGRELAGRPYLESTLPYKGFTISPVYTSRHNMQACITVMHAVRDEDNILGFIAADFTVENLPLKKVKSEVSTPWKQYKGDPAIRGTLFMQERVLSAMDEVLDETMAVLTDLMQHHGIFHCKIHFSSSRVSMWSVDDPFDYNIHQLEDLTDPERCLAYPRQPMHKRAQISEDEIALVFRLFKKLRNADETVYLRSSSINIINGMIGLTFSCDGSHYVHYSEFLSKDTDFWFGANAETCDVDESSQSLQA